ncbi:MAG TPA: ATP-binding protein [bacterium]|nr:ATP-binding protein [bacterium]HOR57090.1 ATP-binding protein [bacterium]HPL56127.1 ATP-binding protein [bacterium]
MTFLLEQGGLLFGWSTIITGVGNVLLAVAILFVAEKKPSNIYFAIMGAALGLISVTNYFSLTSYGSPERTLFWIRAVMVLVAIMMTFLYGFGISYENRLYKFNLRRGLVIGAIGVVVAIISASPLTYQNISFADDGAIVPHTGPGMIVVAMFILPIFVATVVAMAKNARRAVSEQKRNINIALYAFLLCFGVQIITSFVIVAALGYTKLVPVGNLLSLAYIVLITMSILRYKIINLNVASSLVFVVVLGVMLFADIFSASNTEERIYRAIVFLAAAMIGYQFIRAIITDTKRKRQLEYYSQELKGLNEKLKRTDAIKTEFISMASHELLTPISAIEGYLSMMVDEKIVAVGNPKAEKYLQSVYKSSNRLARLVADLLNVSRIEEERLLIEKKAVSILEMLQSTIDELRFKALASRITMNYTSQVSGQDALAYADSDKIKEVLINLSGNAIKFNRPGGVVHLWAQVWPTQAVQQRYNQMARLAVNRPEHGDGALKRIVSQIYTQMVGDKQMVIAVADNGVGISREDIGKLFQKFSRVGDWSTQEVQGTGLGLYISRAIVEMHHGRIWVESPGEGRGSIFYFSLPLAQYSATIAQLDARAPHNKNMKGLARMGGGPAAK